MEIKDFMSKDHDRLDGIFENFRKVKNKGNQKAKLLFSEFKTGLQRHIVWEEEILFPIFEAKMKINPSGMYAGGPTVMMRMEHSQIRDFLEKINERVEKENTQTDDLEAWLLEVLTAHNDKEENILYPWIDECATQKEIKEAFIKMEKVPKEKFNV